MRYFVPFGCFYAKNQINLIFFVKKSLKYLCENIDELRKKRYNIISVYMTQKNIGGRSNESL